MFCRTDAAPDQIQDSYEAELRQCRGGRDHTGFRVGYERPLSISGSLGGHVMGKGRQGIGDGAEARRRSSERSRGGGDQSHFVTRDVEREN